LNKTLLALIALTLAAVLFAVPLLLRLEFQQGLLFGEESYRNILISESIASSTHATPFHLAVSSLGRVLGLEVASELLPIIFGALSAIFLYLIVRKLEPDFSVSVLTIGVFATIPASMYVFSASVPASMALFIAAFAFYASLFRNWAMKIVSIALTIILLSFGVFQFLFSAVILISSFLKSRNKQLVFIGLLSIAAITSWIIGIASSSIQFNGFFSSLVADFGGLFGIGVFHFILTCIGIIVLWPHRLSAAQMYFSAIFILGAFGIFGSQIIVYAVFLVAFFSAVALKWIADFKWDSKLIRVFTLALVAFGILFSTGSYMERISVMEPTPDLVAGLDWLRQQPPGIVLSDPSNTFWIEYFAKMDALAEPGVNDAKISKLFASRNLEFTNETLHSYGVRYIWIDPSMKEGKVWKKPQEGMLFLFRSNVTFLKLDERSGIETWEYIGGK
jgi:hypothetical protein